MDDVRVGRVIRALRRRRGWRQADLAHAARVSQPLISRLERGHAATLTLATIRSVLNALDARTDLSVSWRGGELDRLVDEQHAALGAATIRAMARLGWSHVVPEVTFARYGERGSIDLAGLDREREAAVIIELKSELTSYEETQRRLDVKARLASWKVEDRFGWRPRHVAVVLVLADTRTNRDRAHRVAGLLKAALPADALEMRRWLKQPSGRLAGVWFVRVIPDRNANRRIGGAHRVRRSNAA